MGSYLPPLRVSSGGPRGYTLPDGTATGTPRHGRPRLQTAMFLLAVHDPLHGAGKTRQMAARAPVERQGEVDRRGQMSNLELELLLEEAAPGAVLVCSSEGGDHLLVEHDARAGIHSLNGLQEWTDVRESAEDDPGAHVVATKQPRRSGELVNKRRRPDRIPVRTEIELAVHRRLAQRRDLGGIVEGGLFFVELQIQSQEVVSTRLVHPVE